METNNIEMITKMVIDAINKNEDKGNGFVVPIGVSARHIHLLSFGFMTELNTKHTGRKP